MVKDLSHNAAEFTIEPIQPRRLGWDNEIVVSFSGRGEQRRQHLVSKKKESTYGSEPSRQYFISATAVHLADQLLASELLQIISGLPRPYGESRPLVCPRTCWAS